MAITIISQPAIINTAFNPNNWVINSTNKDKPGFRYLIVIKESQSNKIIHKSKIIPSPINGYGEFSLFKVLTDRLENDINFTNMNSNGHYNNDYFQLNYKIEFGEEYITPWNFTDTVFVSGGTTKAIQTPNTTAHTFVVGDTLNIIPTIPSLFPAFNGLAIVKSVPNSYEVEFNIPFESTAINAGIIQYADNRKTQYNNLLTSDVKKVIKSVIPFYEWPDTIVPQFLLQDETRQILTNFKTDYYINSSQDLYWPFLTDVNTFTITMNYKRDDGSLFTKNIGTSYFTTHFGNVTLKSGYTTGTGTLFTDDIKYYDFWITKPDGANPPIVISKTYRINVNNNCKITDYEILFEDRLGAYSSFAFTAMPSENINVIKEEYNQIVKMNNSKYDQRTAQGTKNINIDFTKEITLRTNTILNREQDNYFEELLTSGNTYIKINGKYQRVVILTNSAEFKNVKQTGLRRREIKVSLANKNTINY